MSSSTSGSRAEHSARRSTAPDGDREQLAALAAAFDRLALAMVTDDRAHGDLKPGTLIVDPAGRLHPIDHDATFLPAFAGAESRAGHRSLPAPGPHGGRLRRLAGRLPRGADLHGAARPGRGGLYARYGAGDGLLFTRRRFRTRRPYREVVALFERRGMAVAYRIARLLTAPTLRLFGLEELLREAVREADGGRAGGGARRRPRTRTVRTRRTVGLPHPNRVRHRTALRQWLRIFRRAGGRAARRHLALHRPPGPHAHQLPGLRGGQAPSATAAPGSSAAASVRK